MDTELSDEQTLLRHSAGEFLAKHAPLSEVRRLETEASGYHIAAWVEMARLGWQGLVVPERYGGTGASLVELTILVEEIGGALCPVPLVSTALCSRAILRSGSGRQQQRWLPPIAGGDAIWTVGYAEPSGSWEPEAVSLRARRSGDSFMLDGVKVFVQDARAADWILVVGRGPGPEDRGYVAAAVEATAPGVVIEDLSTFGADRQSIVRFDGTPVPPDQILETTAAEGGLPPDWLQALLDDAAVLECAYLSGLARRDLELAVEHARHRVQFGQPIGSFQAVQHACADMLTDVDCSRLATYRAAWCVAEGEPDAPLAVAVAKAWSSEASQRVVSGCQQVSGAMGFTRDYDSQLFFRRQKRAELFWGDADFHRERVARIMAAAQGGAR